MTQLWVRQSDKIYINTIGFLFYSSRFFRYTYVYAIIIFGIFQTFAYANYIVYKLHNIVFDNIKINIVENIQVVFIVV